ncbi:hypothetical protein VTN02DRAFT_737 [Thermoascus thermophilus]
MGHGKSSFSLAAGTSIKLRWKNGARAGTYTLEKRKRESPSSHATYRISVMSKKLQTRSGEIRTDSIFSYAMRVRCALSLSLSLSLFLFSFFFLCAKSSVFGNKDNTSYSIIYNYFQNSRSRYNAQVQAFASEYRMDFRFQLRWPPDSGDPAFAPLEGHDD